MEFVQDLSLSVRTMAANMNLGLFLIPIVVVAAILLVLFAQNNYKIFRVGLPLCSALAGAYIGAGLLGPMLKAAVPALADYVNPLLLTGGVVAVVLGLLCAKFHKTTMCIVGLGIGALGLDGLVKGLLWKFDFVHQIAESVPGGKSGAIVFIVGMLILLACAVVCAVVLVKYFHIIYILVTGIGGWVVALGLPAIFLFPEFPIAVVICASIGLVIGILTVKKQLKEFI